MKFTEGESKQVDKNTEITDLFDVPESSNFDAVISEIDGYHPADTGRKRFLNKNSQKAYYILEGSGQIFVDGEEFEIKKGDFVNVAKKTPHALEGEFRALIITSPPFNPEDEKLVDRK